MWVLLLVICLVLWLFYSWLTMKPKNFPPGPPYIPLLGSVPWMSGVNLHLQMEKWREEYGPLVGVMLGKFAALAVVEPKAVLEVLRAEHFQGRLNVGVIRDTSNERLGVFQTDGPYWVEQRRFSLRHLKEFGFGKASMEGMILLEADELLKELKQGDNIVQVAGLFSVSVINVLWAVIAGVRYERDDEEFKSLLVKLNRQFRAGDPSGSSFVQLCPPLRWLSPTYRETWQNNIDLQNFVMSTLKEHERTFDENSLRDFMDVYIKEMRESPANSSFTERSLVCVCLDLFSAGAESTSNTLGFALLYMVLHPELQARVHDELDAVVGRGRKPSLQDRLSLVYVEAVLLEVSRINTIAPFTIPHRATANTTLGGYDIPKNTTVLVSLWSCLQDPEHWGDPTVFRPERHIGKDGRIIRDEFMVSFGTGKRACLGEALAKNTLFLFFTTLLQELEFQIPSGDESPSTDPQPGFTHSPRPFRVMVKKRGS